MKPGDLYVYDKKNMGVWHLEIINFNRMWTDHETVELKMDYTYMFISQNANNTRILGHGQVIKLGNRTFNGTFIPVKAS